MGPTAAEEQEAKRRRLDDAEGEVKEEEPAKETEGDAPPDSRSRLTQSVGFLLRDCTLNIVPTQEGRVLSPLSGGGLQYFISGARANTGVTKGRYCFEVKAIAMMNPIEQPQALRGAAPQPRQMLRVGFATQGSSLFLGETSDSVCFDSEGGYTSEAKREMGGEKIIREQTVCLVLNLDPGSPNKNTISLFKDGQRLSEPKALPECLLGKPLFPVVNFRNIIVQVHFGPTPLVPLPFVCRGLQDMAEADSALAPPDTGKDGTYEVLLPVGIPDEGTFSWLDEFLAKNPQYTELSDRALLRWAESSGMKSTGSSLWKHSNDKPDVKFNIPMMDDWSIRKILSSVVAAQPRNYVVMEVKANLLETERAQLLKRFALPCYRKVAQVIAGEPPSDFVASVQEKILKQKQEEMDLEWTKRMEEKKRKKFAEARLREIKEQRSKAAESKDEGKKDEDEAKEEEKASEAKEEVKKEEDESKAMEVDEEEPKPVAKLTDEEKALKFGKQSATDLTAPVLGANFKKFSLPQAGGEEGFDEVRYAWADATKSEEYFKEWLGKAKVLTRVEDLQPGEWAKSKLPVWNKALTEWKKKQNMWKDPKKQAAAKAAAKKEAEKAASPKADGEKTDEKADGDEKPAEEDKKEEKPDVEMKEAEPADPLTVEDICDIGDGEPLFAKFALEDWALLSIRFELFLLAHSFPKDAQDPERTGIHETNIAFYFQKYTRKQLNIKYYGVDTVAALVKMVSDTAKLSDDKILAADLPEDIPIDMFVRLTEEKRRVRQKKIDDGDESARLKFGITTPEVTTTAAPATQGPQGIAPRAAGGLGTSAKAGGGMPPAPPPPTRGGWGKGAAVSYGQGYGSKAAGGAPKGGRSWGYPMYGHNAS